MTCERRGTHLLHSDDALSLQGQLTDELAGPARQEEQEPAGEEPGAFAPEESHKAAQRRALVGLGEEDVGEDLARRRVERERVGEAAQRFLVRRRERVLLERREGAGGAGGAVVVVVLLVVAVARGRRRRVALARRRQVGGAREAAEAQEGREAV